MKSFFPKTVAAVLVAGLLAIVPNKSRAEVTLEMAYMPIVPCSQLFVIEGMGWAKKAGINLKLTRFSNGPAIVQAIASGKMDLMCFGIGPAMVSRGKGVKLKVIAGGIVSQISVIAQGDLVKYFDKYQDGAKAIRAFTKDKGRKPKIASFPKGSVPDTVTRHWILRMMKIKLDEVKLIGMGAARVQQALLSKSVDAAGILEPIVTIVKSKLKGSKVVAGTNDMMPGHPGSTMAAREKVIKKHRAAIIKLTELHIKATKFLKEHPEAAVKHVKNFIAKGLLKDAIVLEALKASAPNFEDDPTKIQLQTLYMHDFQKAEKINMKVSVKGLFDLSIHKAAKKSYMMMKK
ncbi:MAG: ABC transporter substrate-binding protein [Proteobacteria bacterium]|nr:ABC transporter substrate-binding protein [Pseudomonadota bacterium]MDA1022324.1 ABC transporter substrate-binding protein [Pseudomonadota bacterium]